MATAGGATAVPTPCVAIASGIVAEQTGRTIGPSIDVIAASVIEQHERRFR